MQRKNNSADFFRNINFIGQTVLSRDAAKTVAEEASKRSILLTGLDVGFLDKDRRYSEDPNEGWVISNNMFNKFELDQIDTGKVSTPVLERVNRSAGVAIDETSIEFDAFILTYRKITIV